MPELIGSFLGLESDCLTLPPSGRLAGCGIAANPSEQQATFKNTLHPSPKGCKYL